MYDSPEAFVDYWKGFRTRTTRLLTVLRPEDLEWAPGEGRFTFGDLFRHLPGIERYMYGETVQGRPSAYPGHSTELASGLDGVKAYLDRLHQESVAIFSSLTREQLQSRCLTPAGSPITVWKWLRAMVEHEAHHRGQLHMMASLRGLRTPPLFGLTEEEVAALSRGKGAA